ncbi:MAG: glutamine-hydrolyzing carbamoyl-phosphate synthase small subunit, partial [Flavobacteriales bacterium]
MTRTNQAAVLLLADGTVFHGKTCGAPGTATGEIAFNTAMTGYQEVFTDPSYYGQVLVMATSHIGNYGTHGSEMESMKCQVSAIVIKKFSDVMSRPSGNATLQDFLVRDGVVGICDLDTRALVRHIRMHGAQNCLVSTEVDKMETLAEQLKQVPSMDGLSLSQHVACDAAYELGSPDASFRIAVLDFGVKQNILRCLTDRRAFLKVFPLHTTAQEVRAWNPDGIMFSNGPGDPGAMPEAIHLVRDLVNSGIPGFGICLGHQLIALSQGLKTVKMFNGHRGINHPVKNLMTGRCEITSQNHGFVISEESIAGNEEISVTHRH